MRTEVSAGGVVYRKKGSKFEILLLKDKNDNWTFPKGIIEDDENKLKTAAREVTEEVGIHRIKFIDKLSPVGYWYKWKDNLVKKTVYYFLYKAIGKETPKPQEEEGIKEIKWFTPEEALKVVGYRKTNEPILKEVIKKIYENP